jgi:hypothetical protein
MAQRTQGSKVSSTSRREDSPLQARSCSSYVQRSRRPESVCRARLNAALRSVRQRPACLYQRIAADTVLQNPSLKRRPATAPGLGRTAPLGYRAPHGQAQLPPQVGLARTLGVTGMTARRSSRVPDESAWYGYEADLDVRYLHNLFFGKTADEVQEYFVDDRAIERSDELLFAPRPVFQYYIQAFTKFLQSELGAGESDAASPFLHLLVNREEKDPGSVREIYSLLEECVEFVGGNQAYFEAPVDIYGDFRKQALRIHQLCKAP